MNSVSLFDKKYHSKFREIQNLDDILSLPVRSDMDLMDFFLVAGWYYAGSSLFLKGSKPVREGIVRYTKEMRKRLSRSQKILQSRFARGCNILYHGYGGATQVATIGDLQSEIADRGMIVPGARYPCLAEFNKTLSNYEMEEIKVGGRGTYQKSLDKYGLKKANDN